MIIKKIYIENFGKLQNFTLNLNKGLNQVLNENGFGKTTLSIFVKAMFYGMPASRENLKMERKKYMPWQGGNFGGYIEFEHGNDIFRATRYFAKTPEGDTFELFNMNTNKIVDLKGRELGEVLFGIGKDTFEMTAFFPQFNFSVLKNQQISANILGLDKFKYDLANLNTAVAEIKKKIAEVKKNKPKKEDIEILKQKSKGLELEILQLGERITELTTELTYRLQKLSDLEGQADKEKKFQEQTSKILEQKRLIENKLLQQQEQLNVFLKELASLREQEKLLQADKTDKTRKKKSLVVFAVILCILTVLGISIIVLSLLLSWSLIVWITSIILVLILWGVFGFLLFKYKKITKEDLSDSDLKSQEAVLFKKIELYNNEIESLNSILIQYQDAQNPNLSILEEFSNMINQQKLNNQSIIHQIEVSKQQLDNLNEKKDVLNTEIEQKEEMYSQSSKKIDLLTKTKDFLLKANENVSSRFVEPANKTINQILSKFDVRNREFVVDANFDIKEITAVGVKEQEYSSQGYRDILAFCVRIYFLQEIYKEEKPFIILDDTFVNLDDDNLKRVRLLLQELEHEYQIIYLCCNSRCSMR